MSELTADIYKTLGAVEKTAEAAHTRLDRVENEIKADIKGIITSVQLLTVEVHKLDKEDAKKSGWTEGAKWAFGIVGTGLGYLISHFLK